MTRSWAKAVWLISWALSAQPAVGEETSVSSPPRVASSDISANLERLNQRLDRQEAEIADLRHELEAARAASANAAAQGRDFRLDAGAGAGPGFIPFVTARGFGLLLSGFVQADDVLYNQSSQDQINQSTGAPLNETRFLIRRAHLRADLSYGIVGGAFEVEASTVRDASVRIFDADVSVRWPSADPEAPPYVMGTLGLYRVPFGFENPQRDYDRLFLERSAMIRAFFPGENDLGLGISGGWRGLRYALSMMNGHPIAEGLFPYRDPTAAKDFLGRVGVDTFVTHAINFRGGVSALTGTGFHPGTFATKDTLVWRDGNEDGLVQLPELQVIPGQTAQPSQSFMHFALGGDLGVTAQWSSLGQTVLYGELVWANNLDRAIVPADQVGAAHNLRELGWYVGATQELTPHAQLGVRYDVYNPDADAQTRIALNVVPKDLTFTTLAVAAAWRYGSLLRVVLEYDHNTNALGLTTGGLPTTLAADVLTLRGQVRL